MLKLPKIHIEYYDNIQVPVEIVYHKRGPNWLVIVYTIHSSPSYGKGVAFSSTQSPGYEKFTERLNKLSVHQRLRVIYRLIRKLKGHIEDQDIRLKGVFKYTNDKSGKLIITKKDEL